MGWLIDWRINRARTTRGPQQLLCVRDVVEFRLRAPGDAPAGPGDAPSAQESHARHRANWERPFQLTVIPSAGSPRTVISEESDPLRVEYRFDYPGTKTLHFTGTPRRRPHQTAAAGRTPQVSAAFDPVDERLTVEVLERTAFLRATRGRASEEPLEERPAGEVGATTRGAAGPAYRRAAEARRQSRAALEAFRRATEGERRRRRRAGATVGLLDRSFEVKSEADILRITVDQKEQYLIDLNQEVACTPPLDLNDIPLPREVGFPGSYHWDFDEGRGRIEFFRVPSPRPYVRPGGGGYRQVWPDPEARERWQRQERRRAIRYRPSDWLVVIPPGETRPTLIAAALLPGYLRRQAFLDLVSAVSDIVMFLVPIEGWMLRALRAIVRVVGEARLAAAIVRVAGRLRGATGLAIGAPARLGGRAEERAVLEAAGRAITAESRGLAADARGSSAAARGTGSTRVAGEEVFGELTEELGLRGAASGARGRSRNIYLDFERVLDDMQPVARGQVARLATQLRIRLPEDRILVAPWVGRIRNEAGELLSSGTSQGWLRSEGRFWTAFRRAFPDDYRLIGPNRTVTRALAERYGWVDGTEVRFVGERLVHHHIENSQFVVAIPESLHHDLSGVIHGLPEIIASP